MSEVPKYWKEFRDVTDNWVQRVNDMVDEEDARRRAEYNKRPWYKKIFCYHPGGLNWKVEMLIYGARLCDKQKYTKGTIEEYYQWLIDTGRA